MISTISVTIILLLLLPRRCFFLSPFLPGRVLAWRGDILGCCMNNLMRLSPEHILHIPLTLCGVISLNNVYQSHARTPQMASIWNFFFLSQNSRLVSHQPALSKTETNLMPSSVERSDKIGFTIWICSCQPTEVISNVVFPVEACGNVLAVSVAINIFYKVKKKPDNFSSTYYGASIFGEWKWKTKLHKKKTVAKINYELR